MNKQNLTGLLNLSESHSLKASQNPNLKTTIALTVVTKMLKGSHFSICAIDNACGLIGARNSGPAYKMLYALHCVHFDEMPVEVLDSLPALMREVFSQVKMDDQTISEVFKGIRA